MTLHRSHYPSTNEVLALAKAGILKTPWRTSTAPCPEPISPEVDLADKVDGMLLGLAIGDALGNTSESRNPERRRAEFGWIESYRPNVHCGGLCVGLPSDDTQLAAWTIEQILELGRLEPQLLGYRFSAERIYGVGSAVREFLGNFKRGVPWTHSGAQSAGNGALMRIAPVILPYIRQPSSDIWADTLMAAHLTHNDDLSNSSCLALVHVLWQLIGMRTAPERAWWIREWSAMAGSASDGQHYESRGGHPQDFNGTMLELLQRYVVPALERDLSVEEACGIWHSGAYLLETVPSVLYILSRHGHDPRRAILEAVNNTRDNDTIAAIVGAAVGALHGAHALPQEWVTGLLGRTRATDDHHVFLLLTQCAAKLRWKPREETLMRAASAITRPLDAGDSALAPGQKLDLGQTGYWIKYVGFMVHTWCVIRDDAVTGNCRVWFFDDTAAVFDFMDFKNRPSAVNALGSNGFAPFDPADERPESPIAWNDHNEFFWSPRRIYSSGQYWRWPD